MQTRGDASRNRRAEANFHRAPNEAAEVSKYARDTLSMRKSIANRRARARLFGGVCSFLLGIGCVCGCTGRRGCLRCTPRRRASARNAAAAQTSDALAPSAATPAALASYPTVSFNSHSPASTAWSTCTSQIPA